MPEKRNYLLGYGGRLTAPVEITVGGDLFFRREDFRIDPERGWLRGHVLGRGGGAPPR